MGGYPPLGYDVKDRKLVVNEAEAETVRYICRRYQELRSVRLLKEHLDTASIISKHRTAPDGRLSFPKIPSGLDSHRQAESSHPY
jgi:site-specific DNA recombinase